MSKWSSCTLGDVITLQRGHDLPKTCMIDGTFPVAGSNGIIGYHNQCTTSAPGVTVGRSGNIGNAFLYRKNFWAHNTTLYVKDFNSNDEIFIYYFLKNIDFNSFNAGSAVPTLNRNHISLLDIVFPVDLSEQKAIAAILSSLDDKIDLLHRQNTTLEAMAETLFRQWFVVEASEDSEEGLLGDWLSDTFGGDWGKEKPENEFIIAVNCIRGTDIADLQSGLAKKTPFRFIKQKKFISITPKNGDIILEISGGTENQSTGRSIYVNNEIKALFSYPLVFSNFCRLLRPKKQEYSYFLFLYLTYLYKQDEFFNLENGSSGIKNLNYKALLYELNYPMPIEYKVLQFDSEVCILFNKINKNKQQICTLEKLRDTLLPKLMSGEVRVQYEEKVAA